VVRGETNAVTNREGEGTAVEVGILCLASLGEFELSGNGDLDVSKGVKVIGGVGVIGAKER
jgi:hypothetical protein